MHPELAKLGQRTHPNCEGAPAVEGALVCRKHGGSAPQVRYAAEQRNLALKAFTAALDWEAGRGTSREFDLLCKANQAERELAEFEARLAELYRLRELRRREAARASPALPCPERHYVTYTRKTYEMLYLRGEVGQHLQYI